MSRRIWLTLTVALVVTASFATGVAIARESSNADGRSGRVTRGLDYLHARQLATGALAGPANTAWGILGAVATGERMGSSAWSVKGKNPFEYLESISHESASAGADVNNAPVYYARAIMAYVAVGRSDRIFTAGTPNTDLLADLYDYQDTDETSDTYGSFSPSSSSRQYEAVYTTCWAILALHALGEDSSDEFTSACDWLVGQQKDGGGFPSQTGKTADVVTTALAVQALSVAPDGTVDDSVMTAAKSYLRDAQNTDAGFPEKAGGRTSSEATAAGVQAILALGDRPEDSAWKVGTKTPITALGRLQRKTGAYRLTSRSSLRPVTTTSWALMALSRKSFATFPLKIGEARTAFRFKPLLRGLSPKNGAKYTTTNVVLIRATYTDFYSKGTGILPSACRVYVDKTNKSKPAAIGNYGLRLQLNDVPNGSHTYTIEIRDRAGNVKSVTRSFTVNVASSTPTSSPTYHSSTTDDTWPSTTTHRTATPSTTLYATPTATPSSGSPSPTAGAQSVAGGAIASPSSSPSPGAGTSGDEGSAAGYVGGTLLAMLPVGAVVSYLVLHRREEALDEASVGTILPGGGSAWDKVKRRLTRVGDIINPNRS